MKSRINKLKYKFEIDNETKYYFKNNENHRDKDLPAFINKYGSKIWFSKGKFHRDNEKPSHIYSNGRMFWYENGEFIRDNSDEIENK